MFLSHQPALGKREGKKIKPVSFLTKIFSKRKSNLWEQMVQFLLHLSEAANMGEYVEGKEGITKS